MNNNIKICIEGVIGCGKSTLIEELKNYLNYFNNDFVCIKEPIEEWMSMKNEKKQNLFQLYVTNRKRWSFTFQINAILSKIKQLEEIPQENKIILLERSIYTDYYIFSKLAYDNQDMDDNEWNIYQKCFGEIERNNQNIETDGYIYIQTNPETCLNRINKRNRKGENKITKEYIYQLYDKHEQWLINNEKKPVLIISGEPDYYSNDELKNALILKIFKFIQDIQNKNKKPIDNLFLNL